MKNVDITHVYRETAPDAEGNVVSATPAPSPEPDPATTPEVTPDPVVPEDTGQDTIPEEDNLWTKLSKEIDADDSADSDIGDALDAPVPEETPPPAPAEPEPDPAAEPPAETPPVEPPAEPAPVEPAPVIPPVEPAPEVQPTPEPEPEPAPQVGESEEEHAARRTKMETGLQTHFAISDDEALQLVTNARDVFPKLQARMFTDMWMSVEKLIDNRLPGVIEDTTSMMKVRDEKVDDFFRVWPKLNKVTHGQQVGEVSRVFSQVNPTATEAEVIQHVGMQVMLMNKIAPDMAPVGEQPPGTPAAAVVPPEPTPTPYQPAAVNGVPAPQLSASDNEFTRMSYELDEDDS